MHYGNYSLCLSSSSSFKHFLLHSIGLSGPITLLQEWAYNCPRPIRGLLTTLLLELEGEECPYVAFGSQAPSVEPEAGK